jgi:hypothetical protein
MVYEALRKCHTIRYFVAGAAEITDSNPCIAQQSPTDGLKVMRENRTLHDL